MNKIEFEVWINNRACIFILLLGFVFFSHSVHADLKYTVDLRVMVGSEKLEPAAKSSIDAGEGTSLAIGLEYLTQDGETILSVGLGNQFSSNRKSAGCSIICAHPPPDERVDFDFYFLDTVLQFKLGKPAQNDWAGHWLGVGLTYADSIEYKYKNLTGFGTGSTKYDSSVGYLIEYAYRGMIYDDTKTSTVGLRYTVIEFESSQTKVDGSNIMIIYRLGF